MLEVILWILIILVLIFVAYMLLNAFVLWQAQGDCAMLVTDLLLLTGGGFCAAVEICL